jgi:hypothetical protein
MATKIDANNQFDSGVVPLTDAVNYQKVLEIDTRGRDGPLFAQCDVGAGGALNGVQVTKRAYSGASDIVYFDAAGTAAATTAANGSFTLDISDPVCDAICVWLRKAAADTTGRVRGSIM